MGGRTAQEAFWHGGESDGSDERGRGLRGATSRFRCPPPSMPRSRTSYLIPILRQNPGCARFHCSCSGLVTLGEVVAADEHVA